MKKLMFFILPLIAATACTSPKGMVKSKPAAQIIANDSTEFEITILDPQFDTWYQTHYSETVDHSNEFYKLKNGIGVENWNQYFKSNRYGKVVNSYINYNPAEEYGIEVNRKLYWYLKYIEGNFRVPLLR